MKATERERGGGGGSAPAASSGYGGPSYVPPSRSRTVVSDDAPSSGRYGATTRKVKAGTKVKVKVKAGTKEVRANEKEKPEPVPKSTPKPTSKSEPEPDVKQPKGKHDMKKSIDGQMFVDALGGLGRGVQTESGPKVKMTPAEMVRASKPCRNHTLPHTLAARGRYGWPRMAAFRASHPFHANAVGK